MRWRSLIVASVVGAAFAGGCEKERPLLTDDSALLGPAVVRPQKEEPANTAPRSLLDTLPESAGDDEGQVAARVRATVNGVPIFDEEVQAAGYQFFLATRQLPEPERTRKRREIFKQVLDQLVDRELILQDAFGRLEKANPKAAERLRDTANKEFERRWVRAMKEGAKIKGDEELKEFLRRQGLTLESIRRQWVRQLMATEYLRTRVLGEVEKIGHREIRNYYDQHAAEFTIDDSVQWQDLFISAARYSSREVARQFAEELAKRIRSGEDFTTLCKRYDDGDSRLRNGEGIGSKRGEIQPPELEKALFQMRDGEVGPVVEIGSGFHVFRLVKRQYAGLKPFDETVQRGIHAKLRSQAGEREMKRLVADLKRRAVIEYAR